MARPERNDVDYFPFLCKEGKAMYYIENTYGNDGYASWVKILRQLSVTNYHYLNLSDKVEFMFLASKCRVSQEMLNTVINDLCDLGEFHKELWENNRILFSEKLVGTLSDAYSKRNNDCITLDSLLQLLTGLGILKQDKLPSKGVGNPQSKVKESKEKNIYRKFKHLEIDVDEVEKLKKLSYTTFQIDSVLDSIENYAKNKQYVNLYKTALIWLRRNHPEQEENKNNTPKPLNPHEAIIATLVRR